MKVIRPVGVTLVELLCVMSCLAILVGLTFAAWSYHEATLCRNEAMQQVRRAIEYARMQAITQQVPTIYCGSADLQHCDGQWAKGQIIRSEHSAQVLQAYPAVKHVNVLFHANFGRNQQIKFTTTGFTNGQNGHFDFCVKSALAVKPCDSLVLHFSGQTVG